MERVTIVMYHYVRDLKHSRYPEIKGLDVSLFIEQLDFFQKHYNIVTMEAVINAYEGSSDLPPKALLLTFDDAYIDHFHFVFPILDERKLKGAFFPPGRAITQHAVLDVNKIHFILASVADKEILIQEILAQLDMYRDEHDLKSNEFYLNKLSVAAWFDTKEVIFIKRLLQVELAEDLRTIIVNHLFKTYVTNDEEAFSRELYMSLDHIRCMQRNGMHIGSHGYNHYWLGSLSKDKQVEEVDRSLSFIQDVGGDVENWTMCYPYGNYNQDTIDILKNRGCKLGLTTTVGIADVTTHDQYELPRLDTNDFPKDRHAVPNQWYTEG